MPEEWARLVGFLSGLVLIWCPAEARRNAPNPSALPYATPADAPCVGMPLPQGCHAAYDATAVRDLPAGGWYRDPTTGAKIHKLTSATFPTSASPPDCPNGNWGHDYAEGGNEVSLPYQGKTRAILVRQDGHRGCPWWLIDFTPGLGVHNPRKLTGVLAPLRELSFTFSNDPTKPYYAYLSGQVDGGSTIRRIDIRTMAEARGQGWPVTGETEATWLHQAQRDDLFVWMRASQGGTVVGYAPRTRRRKLHVNPDLNEPRIDRAGRYVGLSMNKPHNGLVVWDWRTDTVTWTAPGDGGSPGSPCQIPFAHTASLRRRWLAVDWNLSWPGRFAQFIPDDPGPECDSGQSPPSRQAQHLAGPANGTLVHGSGNWIQYPHDLGDQWALFTSYGELQPTGTTWLAPGGMILLTANGERRLLAHPYNTVPPWELSFLSYPKLSPDGNYVLFTSDMNAADPARRDVFLAELPTQR